ncbi:MAG: hypothetical protein LC772_10075 [Chloroflexi bacterium]|nr:hypothetical protein [Chloroflexota bacterium]
MYRKGWVLYDRANPKESSLDYVARKLNGDTLWKLSTSLDPEEDWATDVCAGGSALVLSLFSGHPGITQLRDVRRWPDLYRWERLLGIDTRSRRVLWISNQRDLGDPVWTNGRVVVAERLDLSKTAVERVAAGASKLPVYLIEYRLTDRRLLWKTRLPGHLPHGYQLLVSRGVAHRATFRFVERSMDASIGERIEPSYPQFHYLRRLDVDIPIVRGSVEVSARLPQVKWYSLGR